MTHTNFTDQTPNSQFNKDYNQLHKDSDAYNKALSNIESIKKLFQSVWTEIIGKIGSVKKHPGEALVLLTVLFFGKAMNDHYEKQLEVEAKAVNVQEDMSKLTNDLQNIVNNNGSVNDELNGAQKLIDLLDGKGPAWGAYVQDAIGKQTAPYLANNYKNIVDTINKYFKGSGSMTSFKEMHDDLKKQNEPDAQAANKAFVDAYNQNISATQSLGQAASTEVGLITSKLKTNTTTVSDLMQDFLTLGRTYVKNQISQ